MNRVIEIDFEVDEGWYDLEGIEGFYDQAPEPHVLTCEACGNQTWAVVDDEPVCLNCAMVEAPE